MTQFVDKLRIPLLLLLAATAFVGLTACFILGERANDVGLTFIADMPNPNGYARKIAYISGEVLYPGVYQIGGDMRVAELIEKAGGLTKHADSNVVAQELNLAKILADQDHIFVPLPKSTTRQTSTGSSSSSGSKISINSASKSQLEELPGVGPATAEAIIEGRPYQKIDDLLEVAGIGDATLAKFSALVEL